MKPGDTGCDTGCDSDYHTDLARFIDTAPLSDTHEHLQTEEFSIQFPPDVLSDLFGNYVQADLVVAGATQETFNRLLADICTNL
jgi:hypothetical protein